MQNTTIAFIGGGNMARSLIAGLLSKDYPADKIVVSDPDENKLQELQNDFGVNIQQDNKTAANMSEVVFFAVKPQILRNVAVDLVEIIQQRGPLVISVAIGIPLSVLQCWLGGYKIIIRSMPNTPVAVSEGMVGLYADKAIAQDHRELATAIFNTVGQVLWAENEKLIDVIAALSGSGPAMIFLVMEALQKAGEKLGLTTKAAQQLTLQTILGSGKLASISEQDVVQLRKQVTSPNGTTERAIAALQDGKLEELFVTAMAAAIKRAQELAATYEKE
jgi:pyrroline-5-carboxylate reductase